MLSSQSDLSTSEMPQWLFDGKPEGTHVTAKGYLRIHRRGPYRDWLHHRYIMQQMVEVFCFYGPEALKMLTVHHVNYVKTQNDPSNLILLDPVIHGYISNRHRIVVQEANLTEKEIEELNNNAREV